MAGREAVHKGHKDVEQQVCHNQKCGGKYGAISTTMSTRAIFIKTSLTLLLITIFEVYSITYRENYSLFHGVDFDMVFSITASTSTYLNPPFVKATD